MDCILKDEINNVQDLKKRSLFTYKYFTLLEAVMKQRDMEGVVIEKTDAITVSSLDSLDGAMEIPLEKESESEPEIVLDKKPKKKPVAKKTKEPVVKRGKGRPKKK